MPAQLSGGLGDTIRIIVCQKAGVVHRLQNEVVDHFLGLEDPAEFCEIPLGVGRDRACTDLQSMIDSGERLFVGHYLRRFPEDPDIPGR